MEEWKIVPSFPELQASSYGRILRLPYFSIQGKEIISLPTYGNKVYVNGRPYRMLYMRRAFGTLKVHQLVCEAFHGTKPFVNAYVLHKDENPFNNNKDNVYWGTQKENLNAPGFLVYCASRTGDSSPVRKGLFNGY